MADSFRSIKEIHSGHTPAHPERLAKAREHAQKQIQHWNDVLAVVNAEYAELQLKGLAEQKQG